jgi:hypothetical protein
MAGIFCLALTVGSGACSSQGSNQSAGAVPKGCYAGAFHLKIRPSVAEPGNLVIVDAHGPWDSRNVGTESYGLLGIVKSGRFIPIYNLAAIVAGIRREQNVPVGPSGGVGGVGLPNRPFRIEVPPVPGGHYIVQFSYSIAPGKTGAEGPKLYDLCTSLLVK